LESDICVFSPEDGSVSNYMLWENFRHSFMSL
jgi:hypothetical protein